MVSTVLHLGLLSLLLLAMATTPSAGDDNPGTTEHIKNIFIGRCYDYKQIKYRDLLPGVDQDCEGLYNKFFSGFANQPPCDVSMQQYMPFMQAAKQELPKDKAMFWSGTKQLAHEYAASGLRYVTLEDTLIGYVVDSVVWCGQGSPPGMNYTRCPSWADCPREASESFWAAASMTFAASARGQVMAMVDGSDPSRPAYRQDSFFGKFELPHLDTSVVTGVLVLLTHPLEKEPYETCETGSLLLMEQDVTARNLSFACEDDPQAILHLLCADDPSDAECRLATGNIFPNALVQPPRARRARPLLNAKPDRFQPTIG